jgi:hypothetical protein
MMYLRSKLEVTTHKRVVPIVPHYIRTSFLHSLYSFLTLEGMKGVACFIVNDASRGTVRQIVLRWMIPSSSVSWSFTTPWSESFTWNDSFRNDPSVVVTPLPSSHARVVWWNLSQCETIPAHETHRWNSKRNLKCSNWGYVYPYRYIKC